MPDPIDYNQAGEIFKKSMQDALSHLDKVTEDARKEHEKAIDLQIAAKEEIHRIENEAHVISQNYIDQHRKEFEERLRQETLLSVTKKLIMHGMKSAEIMTVLAIPPKMMQDAWTELKFTKLGDHVAHVAYEDQGRAGNVIFYREDVMLRFWYEFGGGLTLAFINVPKAENWTKETGLPAEDRMPILNFIGERVIRDQASGYRYRIEDDAIVIAP